MIAMEQLPTHLYTVGEYVALGETEYRSELQEGHIIVSPSPLSDHSMAQIELVAQVRAQLPPNLVVLQDIDVDLGLAPEDEPGTVRRPDVFVVSRADRKRARAEGRILRASELLLAVEIVSPGSRRMDYQFKRVEYAEAGIPHYWIVDLDDPISLLSCQLTNEFGYVDNGEATRKFSATEPFPAEIDLTSLLD